MKIYTRTGDRGQTGLLGGSRVSKASLRIAAIGDVDEWNSTLGVARLDADSRLSADLGRIQSLLFDLGAELAAVPGDKFDFPRILDEDVAWIETSIDDMTAQMPDLTAFILPGGGRLAAHLHLSRCVGRRAERTILQLSETEPVRDPLLRFVNRLSDWLFTAARFANHQAGIQDVLWESAKR